MNENIAFNLETLGAKHWTKNGYDRYYIDIDRLSDIVPTGIGEPGHRVFYVNGWDEVEIPLTAKIYYDANTELVTVHGDRDFKLANAIQDALEAEPTYAECF